MRATLDEWYYPLNMFMARDQSDVHAFRAAGDFDDRLMELRLHWHGDDGQPASMSAAIRLAVDFAWAHLVKNDAIGQMKSRGPSWEQSWWSEEDRKMRPSRSGRLDPARCQRCGETGFNCWC